MGAAPVYNPTNSAHGSPLSTASPAPPDLLTTAVRGREVIAHCAFNAPFPGRCGAVGHVPCLLATRVSSGRKVCSGSLPSFSWIGVVCVCVRVKFYEFFTYMYFGY